jgi:hypothetical protein
VRTTEEAILKFKEVHSESYDYSEYEYVKAHEKSTVICSIHGPWKVSYSNHAKGRGCPSCRHKGRSWVNADGSNSMAVTHPNLAKELHPSKNGEITPENITAGSNRKLWWLCNKCGREWDAVVHSRKSAKIYDGGCKHCTRTKKLKISKKTRVPKITKPMRITHPEISKEFHPTKNPNYSIDLPSPKGTEKVWWICSNCDNEFQQIFRGRKFGYPCKACSGQGVHSDGRNSMAVTHPKLAIELHPTKNGDLTPKIIMAGTSKSLFWQCSECTHLWGATGNNRANKGTGCPACYGRVVKPDGSNSLATQFPELLEELHPIKNGDFSPHEITSKSPTMLWWICNSCNYEWETLCKNRTRMKSGCPVCAEYGINPDEPTKIYAMRIEGPKGIWWWKAGISIDPERRANQIQSSLQRSGMNLEVIVHQVIDVETGRDALEMEKKLLSFTEKRVTTIEKFDGNSELFSCNPLELIEK